MNPYEPYGESSGTTWPSHSRRDVHNPLELDAPILTVEERVNQSKRWLPSLFTFFCACARRPHGDDSDTESEEHYPVDRDNAMITEGHRTLLPAILSTDTRRVAGPLQKGCVASHPLATSNSTFSFNDLPLKPLVHDVNAPFSEDDYPSEGGCCSAAPPRQESSRLEEQWVAADGVLEESTDAPTAQNETA